MRGRHRARRVAADFPVTIEFGTDDTATGITLRNPGERPVYGQVRVFRWDQPTVDTLTPTQDLVAGRR